MAQRSAARDGYSLGQAVREVFGPDFAWMSWVVVVAGGLLGAACAPLFRGPAEAPRLWVGPFVGASIGVVLGGLVTLIPRAAGLVALGAGLRMRPADLGDAARPWWPLRLVAAALADTPPLRRTAQDFTDAVNAVVPHSRGLVGRRLWPACAAAFAAPALGLVGAWQAWAACIDSRELGVGRVPTVGEKAALPMALSILASLVLMVAIVGIDQWIRRLLLRWATTVNDTDATSAFVAAQLGDGMAIRMADAADRLAGGSSGGVTVPPDRQPPVREPAPPPISADAIEGLGNIFKNG